MPGQNSSDRSFSVGEALLRAKKAETKETDVKKCMAGKCLAVRLKFWKLNGEVGRI